MPRPTETPTPPRREIGIRHWRRELGQCAEPALLVDEALSVLESNLPARELGIAPALPFAAWMQALQGRRGGAGEEVCVSYVPVQFKDFRGWFVAPCGSETGSKSRRVESLEKKLDEAKRRLAAEIRRRQFLERRILVVSNGERRDETGDLAAS